MGSKEDRLGESESKGSGDRIEIRDRQGRGGDTEHSKRGGRLEWGRMECSECRPVGC